MRFHIVNFNFSIAEKILGNSITFAKHHTTARDQEINIFNHSRFILFQRYMDKNSDKPDKSDNSDMKICWFIYTR